MKLRKNKKRIIRAINTYICSDDCPKCNSEDTELEADWNNMNDTLTIYIYCCDCDEYQEIIETIEKPSKRLLKYAKRLLTVHNIE